MNRRGNYAVLCILLLAYAGAWLVLLWAIGDCTN